MSEGRAGERPFRATDIQLRRKFKPAFVFGVGGPYNRENGALFAQALAAHVADLESRPVAIRYGRGVGSGGFAAICYVRERTWLAVVTTTGGTFVTGYELSPEQMDNVLRRGKLGGG